MTTAQKPNSHSRPPELAVLVEEAKKGNRRAFEKVVERFHEDIFRMVYYRTRSQMDAEDITQDIFISVYNNLSNLKNTELFRSWLYRIGINKIKDFYRKKKVMAIFSPLLGDKPSTEPELSQADKKNGHRGSDGDDPLDAVIKKEFWEHVGQFTNKLSYMEKEVFTLRFMDQLSIIEISRVLTKNENTIKTHLYRAIRKFQNSAAVLKSLKEETE